MSIIFAKIIYFPSEVISADKSSMKTIEIRSSWSSPFSRWKKMTTIYCEFVSSKTGKTGWIFHKIHFFNVLNSFNCGNFSFGPRCGEVVMFQSQWFLVGKINSEEFSYYSSNSAISCGFGHINWRNP